MPQGFCQSLLCLTPRCGSHDSGAGGWNVADLQRASWDEIVVHFQELEDPRSTINQRHPLVGVVVLALSAVLAGAGGPTAIARWAALKKDLPSQLLDLPDG